jgi:nucleotide-binding universal stress UspA family protein
MAIKNIICAVNKTSSLSPTIDEASELAKIFDAKVHPIHIIGPLKKSKFSQDELREQLQDQLDHIFLEDQDHIENAKVFKGRFPNELKKITQPLQSPLILIGRQKNGWFKHFTKSRAERLVKKPLCPIWIHPHKSPVLLPKSIICAIDFTDLRAASMAVSIAKNCNTQIHFVHIIPEEANFSDFYISMQDSKVNVDKETHSQTIKNYFIEALAQLDIDEIPYQIHIKFGETSDQISQLYQELNADLLIVGNSSHSKIQHLLMGSTLKYILKENKGDILVVPEISTY